MKRLTILTICLLALALTAFAQTSKWKRTPGLATDITTGADGSMWIIGTDSQPGGFGIYQWSGTNWRRIEGGAEHIAVDRKGYPWIIKSGGEIYQRRGNSWEQMPGTARDIAIGADDSIWIVGTDNQPGGFGIYRWNGRDWAQTDGAARRIAIDKSGNPWVVNAAGEIYQDSANLNGTAGVWQQLPGKASDISGGADGSVWITGTDRQTGGSGIYRWNGSDWEQTDGAARKIVVDRDGNPWVINTEKAVYQRIDNVWTQVPGTATEIAAGADGSMWMIGTGNPSRGYGVHQWRSNNWSKVNDNGAERIAVDRKGNVWTINSRNEIYQKRGNGWTRMPGLARDIAAGADGSVWMIGTDVRGDGFGIYKWNGSDWARVDGAARRIAVDRDGNPWVVNSKGNIFVRK